MADENARFGMTLQEACTLAVGILGNQPTIPDVYAFLSGDGWQLTHESVRTVMYYQLRGATLKIAVPGTGGKPSRWRQTEAARAWVRGETDAPLCGSEG